jgi:ABC-type branched-subunit amino acid transport system ATPase component
MRARTISSTTAIFTVFTDLEAVAWRAFPLKAEGATKAEAEAKAAARQRAVVWTMLTAASRTSGTMAISNQQEVEVARTAGTASEEDVR